MGNSKTLKLFEREIEILETLQHVSPLASAFLIG